MKRFIKFEIELEYVPLSHLIDNMDELKKYPINSIVSFGSQRYGVEGIIIGLTIKEVNARFTLMIEELAQLFNIRRVIKHHISRGVVE